ncbi:hypothetical protein KM043_004758 [Ampulex compressa]|nr:hypothetical protein KM043_004758 [Ampulex compressa]
MKADDSMSDDVFGMDEEGCLAPKRFVSGGLEPPMAGAVVERRSTGTTPSPTGYRDYKPPAEVLNNDYGSIVGKGRSTEGSKRRRSTDDGFVHKTILLGDSGVGKTSLLVQFDTGRFQPGNFAATVGIGFTGPMSGAEAKERDSTRRGRPRSWAFRTSRVSQASDWSSTSAPNSGPRSPAQQLPTESAAVLLGSRDGRWSSRDIPDIPGTPKRSIGSSTSEDSDVWDDLESTCQVTSEDGELLFKVMLLGDSGVGKTCLLTRFRDGRFLAGNYITTIGIDFRNKVVVVDDTRIKLQIWDTAGQERFRSVTHAYYRDAHALLLLYDVTNKTSYDNIRAWLSEIREHANEDVVIVLLGNKFDCGAERAVKREEGERLAQEYRVPFMETSAKTGLNVELAFLAVARDLKARKSNDPDDTKFNVQDYVRQQSRRSSCFGSGCLTST